MAESTTFHSADDTLAYVASSAPTDETDPTDAAYSVVDLQEGHTYRDTSTTTEARTKRGTGTASSLGAESGTIQCRKSRIAADGQDILNAAKAANSEIWLLLCPTGNSQAGRWMKAKISDLAEDSTTGSFDGVTYSYVAAARSTAFTTPSS